MKRRHLEKCMRIINNLVVFCYSQGASECNISITHHDKDMVAYMTVSCPIPGLDQSVIQGFSDELNVPRQHEIEQNYWELCGESEMSDELTLIGMMIDEAKVGYVDGVLYIHVHRQD